MKKKTTDDIGVFNILLIGKCSGAISIADNIHAKFKEEDGSVKNPCNFNIIGDIDSNLECRLEASPPTPRSCGEADLSSQEGLHVRIQNTLHNWNDGRFPSGQSRNI